MLILGHLRKYFCLFLVIFAELSQICIIDQCECPGWLPANSLRTWKAIKAIYSPFSSLQPKKKVCKWQLMLQSVLRGLRNTPCLFTSPSAPLAWFANVDACDQTSDRAHRLIPAGNWVHYLRRSELSSPPLWREHALWPTGISVFFALRLNEFVLKLKCLNHRWIPHWPVWILKSELKV